MNVIRDRVMFSAVWETNKTKSQLLLTLGDELALVKRLAFGELLVQPFFGWVLCFKNLLHILLNVRDALA